MYNVEKKAFTTVQRSSASKLEILKKEVLFRSVKSTYKEFDLKTIEEKIFAK